jgi:hypothetical protein
VTVGEHVRAEVVHRVGIASAIVRYHEVNASDWIFQGELDSNSQSTTFAHQMIRFDGNHDDELAGVDIWIDLLCCAEVVLGELFEGSPGGEKAGDEVRCWFTGLNHSRVGITRTNIDERVKVVELRLVSVVQNHFVDPTLFRVEFDVLERFPDWNDRQLDESLCGQDFPLESSLPPPEFYSQLCFSSRKKSPSATKSDALWKFNSINDPVTI